MPKTTNTEESEYALPAEEPLPARLDSVEVKTINFEKKDGHGNKTGVMDSFDKWVWTFKITGGDYAGLKAYGETEDRMSTRADNKVRAWAEALLGKTFDVGEGLDTDDLIGLSAIVTVRHDEPRAKRDGTMFYGCPVDDVFPADALGARMDEPPF
jgi:hypothetical protein